MSSSIVKNYKKNKVKSESYSFNFVLMSIFILFFVFLIKNRLDIGFQGSSLFFIFGLILVLVLAIYFSFNFVKQSIVVFKRLTGITLEDFVFDTIKLFVLIFLLLITAYPFINTLAISFNDGLETLKNNLIIWPTKFTFGNFAFLMGDPAIAHGFRNSVLRVLINVVTQLIVNGMIAYAFSKKNFVLKGFFTIILIIPMYIGGGLIPTYFLFRFLGILNTFQVYWFTGFVSFYHIILMRTYMQDIPASLSESAYLDGANDWQVFVKIMVPLCVPLFAAISLFISVGSWNDWMTTLIYTNNSNESLTVLQFELQKKLDSLAGLSNKNPEAESQLRSLTGGSNKSPRSIQAAMVIITTVPIIMVYPFLQRYFVHGIRIGGVKE